MDVYAVLAFPVGPVFACLADPARLGDWLAEISAAGPVSPGGDEAEFPVTVTAGGVPAAGTGEVTAFEPPWLAGYRLFAGGRVHGLRITCAAHDGGTRIHIRQSGDGAPLTVDLARLAQAVHAHQGERDNPC